MRRRTVKKGLNILSGGIVAIILATFYHSDFAELFRLSPAGETEFIFLGLFWGGVLGGCGILVAMLGLIRSAQPGERVRMAPALTLLVLLATVFLILWFASSRAPVQPRLAPGETITI